MTVEDRVEKAINMHNAGGNCAQAVACAFSDVTGVGDDTMFRVMEGYGFGMGCMEGTCGAISGAVAVAGTLSSKGSPEGKTKQATYKLSKQILQKFREQNGSSICGELKGMGTGKVLRSCQDCIEDAVRIACEVLGLK